MEGHILYRNLRDRERQRETERQTERQRDRHGYMVDSDGPAKKNKANGVSTRARRQGPVPMLVPSQQRAQK